MCSDQTHRTGLSLVLASLLCWSTAGAAGQAEGEDPAETGVAAGDEVADSAKTVEVYVAPRMIEATPPRFPKDAQIRNQEGWVRVHMMIDSEGKPYEAAVGDSLGGKVFEKEALRIIKKWKFAPANLNGVPLDAGFAAKITFQLSGTAGARRSFTRDYRSLVKEINKGNEARAAERLEKLTPVNLYEDAFYHLGRYLFASRWGDEDTQLHALIRATAYETEAKYLPEEAFLSAMTSRLQLQLKKQHYGSVLRTISALLARKISVDQREPLLALQRELLTVKESEEPLKTARLGQIDTSNRFFMPLFRNKFRVDVLEGEVAELKLRCENGYVFFRYQAELTYEIPREKRTCSLEVVGNPGSQLRIAQF